MVLARRAVRGVLGLGSLNILTYAVSLIVQIGLANLLTPEVFGVVALSLAILKFLTIPTNWGITEAIIQEMDHDDFFATILWVRILFSTALCVLIILSSRLLIPFFSATVLNVLVVLTLGRWMNMICIVFRVFRQREFGLTRIGLIDFLAVVGAGGIALYYGSLYQTVWALVAYYTLRYMFQSIGYVVISPLYPRPAFNWVTIRWLYDFSKSMLFTTTLEDVQERGDDFAVGTLGSAGALGAYSVAWRLARAYTAVIQPAIREGITPTFSKLYGTSEKSRRGMEFIFRMQLHLSVPAYVFAYFAAPTLIPLLFGEQWDSAVPIFRALTVAGALFPLLSTVKNFYYARSEPTLVLRAQVVYLLIMIVGMIALVPTFGGTGAGIAVDAMLFAGIALLGLQLRRDIGFDLLSIGAPATAGCVVSVITGIGYRSAGLSPGIHPIVDLVPLGTVITIAYLVPVAALDYQQIRDDLHVIHRSLS
ncbi:oligosaccharide flippase family protein [Halomicrobium katesii]|uniref:oligosaccharide flippase family protein n=1 Tax=Halomicrobium katesii TaxID=437163 RepID=UPI00036D2AA6|nr:oligosaccharide flippase family protein [Halomicrobium katesii]